MLLGGVTALSAKVEAKHDLHGKFRKTEKEILQALVVLGACGLFLLVIVGASSDSSPKKIGDNSQPSGAPATEAAADTNQPQTFKVGDQVKMGSSVITVNQVSYSQGGQYTHPADGNEWIDLDITIQNTGDSQQYVTTLGQMFVRDGSGNSYQVAVTDKALANPGGSLDGAVIANSKRTGWVGFEIPKGATGLQFQYNGSIFGGGNILIDLGR